jgi:hypothetical protein
VNEAQFLAELMEHGDAILPYEMVTPQSHTGYGGLRPFLENAATDPALSSLIHFIPAEALQHEETSSTPHHHHFHAFPAPLSLLLTLAQHRQTSPTSTPALYIAQAPISSLPRALAAALATPPLVQHAGKGDVYATSLWLGLPPTYTPLHRDPNPNLFVQLCGAKDVVMYPPGVGARIFRDVQRRIGGRGSASLRGSEMMEGEEREVLGEVVWGAGVGESVSARDAEGGKGVGHYEGRVTARVEPGMALFIPKGWWHSIRSVRDGEGEGVVNASVNWWFR